MKTPKSLICSLHSILRFRQVLVITNQETHLVWETVRCDSHVEESNIGTAFAVRRTGGATGINSGFCCSQITGATPLLRSPLRSHLRHRRGLQGHFIPSFTSIIASHLRFPLLLLKVLNRSRGCGYVILHWKLWTNAAVIVAAMWFWRLRKSWCCGGCELQFKTLLLCFLFVFPHFFSGLFEIRFVIPLIRRDTYSTFLTFFWIHSRLWWFLNVENAATTVVVIWFWRLRKFWCCGHNRGCGAQFKTLLVLRFFFVFRHFFVCLWFGLWFRWSEELLTLCS